MKNVAIIINQPVPSNCYIVSREKDCIIVDRSYEKSVFYWK